MKRLFENTFTVSVGYTTSFLAVMFVLFTTSKGYTTYLTAKWQWEANWDSLYNPTFKTYAFIQDMNGKGIDLYAHAESLKPSVLSSKFFIDSLPYAATTALGYVAVWLIGICLIDLMEKRQMAKVSI